MLSCNSKQDVYTIQDLRHPSKDPDNIFLREEKPARLAVIGNPISHSKSPQLHQPALDTLGLNLTYIRVNLQEKDFEEGISILHDLGFIGCNVTVPHKEKALAWAPNKDSFAEQVGVANTIAFSEQKCYTTDPIGFKSAVKETLSYNLDEGRIFVTGAGGGAGSAVSQFIAAHHISHLFLYNRTPEKLDNTYEKILKTSETDMTKVSLYGGSDYPDSNELELLVNATSLGLKADDPSPIPRELIRASHVVYDMTYGCENALSKACQQVGATYVDGLSMLRHQGAEAFKLWFPQETRSANLSEIMGLKKS